MTATTFDRCLSARAREQPDAVALFDETQTVTYGELDAKTHALAERLAASGVVAATRVALIADNSVRHAIAAFAVWRAGGTLVTVYPSSTESELRHALSAATPSVVIAATRVMSTVLEALEGLPATAHELRDDGEVDGLTEHRKPLADDAVVPAGLALICYTSGSTARPKAVMHTHAGLCAAAVAYAQVWHLGADDVALVVLPLAWAFGLVTTTMATLSAGGRVLLLPRSNPQEMLVNMARHRVTFFAGVTTMFVKMVHALESDAMWSRPDHLRLCISGGEPRNEIVFARWREIVGCPVHDVYAASECFPVVTYDPFADPVPRPGCAGRVVPGARLRLVDAAGRDVEPGAPGEAWTRGPATTSGYWGDPDLTAATLTPDGWYRTGDLVEVDTEGYVHVLGRLTDVIIRGGANVSPAEVEAVLVGHAGVQQAVVVGTADPEYGESVVAVLVLEPESTLDEPGLREHCAGVLAGYKVPSRFIAVAELPRNSNTGKIDRRGVSALLADRLAHRLAEGGTT
jgi:long-chain acyl-CoA synthetase